MSHAVGHRLPVLLHSGAPWTWLPLPVCHPPCAPWFSCRVCVGRCTPDCGPAGTPTLQYQLLALPLGIAARRDVVHLTPGTALRRRPLFTLLQQEPGSPFALRTERGRGIISTLRPLREPGTHRLKVQALGGQRAPSTFLLIISVSPYPY